MSQKSVDIFHNLIYDEFNLIREKNKPFDRYSKGKFWRYSLQNHTFDIIILANLYYFVNTKIEKILKYIKKSFAKRECRRKDTPLFLCKKNLIWSTKDKTLCRWKKSKLTDTYINKVIGCERAHAESRFALLMF